jgi:hypothetical protein
LPGQIRKAAELTQIGEALRAKQIRGEAVDLVALVKIEDATGRAMKLLGLITSDHRDRRPKLVKAAKPEAPDLDAYLAREAAAEAVLPAAPRADGRACGSVSCGADGGRPFLLRGVGSCACGARGQGDGAIHDVARVRPGRCRHGGEASASALRSSVSMSAGVGFFT